MKTIEKAVILGFVFTLLISITGFKAHCDNIEQKVLRLHVIANSDTKEDQELKLKVRDRVLSYSKDIFVDVADKKDAEKLTNDNLLAIKKVAQEEVLKNGYNYPVDVELKNTHFNTRVYDEVTLPAGNYDALRVIIGDGNGKNWWCVMFPPMCLPAAEEKCELSEVLDESELKIVSNKSRYEVKFKVVELFEELKNFAESRIS